MLTGDLLRVSRRKGRVEPRLVNPADSTMLEQARALIAAVGDHTGQCRSALDAALESLAPAGTEHTVERGLAKLLLDRCTFETRAKAEPVALRAELFDRSAAAWRTLPLADLAHWRADAMAQAGAAAGAPGAPLSAAEVEDALYADLDANQVVAACDLPTAERLLQRYNVALVQGLLLRADGVEVRGAWPDAARLRQLFHWLKFFGLLFQIQRDERGLCLRVDGPLSVLEHAGRYGLNLAQFAAALLLWPEGWTLTARVRVGRRAQPADLVLTPHPWLKSPLPDRGAWVPEGVRDFVATFNAHAGSWRASPAERIVALPGNTYLIPDFEFVADDGRRVLLEHVLYPTPERIARLLERAALAAKDMGGAARDVGDYWIACKRGSGLPEDDRLVTYRRTLLAGPVRTKLLALDATARAKATGEAEC
jgi:uncharacterized protein